MNLNYLEWMTFDDLPSPEYFFATYNLFQIENKIRSVLGEPVFFSMISCLHAPRRFEYPWVFWHLPKIKKDMKILDAGGGETTFQFYLSLFFDAVYNVDAAKSYLDRVNMIQGKMDAFKNIHTVEGNISSLLFPDDFFDCCACVSVVEHVRRKYGTPYEIIKELSRVASGPVVLTFDVILDDVAGSLKGKKSERRGVDMAELYLLSDKLGFDVPEKQVYTAFIDPETKNTFTVAGLYLGGD